LIQLELLSANAGTSEGLYLCRVLGNRDRRVGILGSGDEDFELSSGWLKAELCLRFWALMKAIVGVGKADQGGLSWKLLAEPLHLI
jgi:hypothetical protein